MIKIFENNVEWRLTWASTCFRNWHNIRNIREHPFNLMGDGAMGFSGFNSFFASRRSGKVVATLFFFYNTPPPPPTLPPLQVKLMFPYSPMLKSCPWTSTFLLIRWKYISKVSIDNISQNSNYPAPFSSIVKAHNYCSDILTIYQKVLFSIRFKTLIFSKHALWSFNNFAYFSSIIMYI